MDETKKYAFRPGAAQGFRNADKSDPQVIAETVEGLREENKGDLRTSHVVDAGQPEDSPIHQNFTHDPDEALDMVQHQEARALMRCYVEVRVGPKEERIERVVNVSIPDGAGGRVWRSAEQIEKSPADQSAVLKLAISGLRQWRRAWNGQIDQTILDAADEVIALAESRLPQKVEA